MPGNVGHMLGCTSGAIRCADAGSPTKTLPGRIVVFHYLPFCFAGSWIMMLTCLLRGSKLSLNTDLSKIAATCALSRRIIS
jgi:long-chain acyl-CoA synthetase